ncbi:hypothetical protein SDC9_115936 [bioreactor metagenome]|uniref:Uncharacterized protein n=1 Tax=bioreactor metagenome TaxID=1076179 RepID=A0A645BU91_9ZZZZ
MAELHINAVCAHCLGNAGSFGKLIHNVFHLFFAQQIAAQPVNGFDGDPA